METDNRPADHLLSDLFQNQVRGFSFFQLVQLLEKYYKPPAFIGRQGPAAGELLRFRPEASLGFPPSDVVSIDALSEQPADAPRYLITISFMGLYGAVSPLPLFFTEEILWSDHEADPVRGFVDLFHHRLISLFYRSWVKYRYYSQFEPGGKDEFSGRMLGLIGLGTAGLKEKTGVPSVRLIRFAGLLTHLPRSASALQGILGDVFKGTPVVIQQCTGRWLKISREQRSELGVKNCSLTRDCSIGEEVFSRTGSFRVSIGPLTFSRFLRFLPGEDSFNLLNEIVKFFVRDRLDFDIELKILGKDIPRLRLVSTDGLFSRETASEVPRLGWTTWLFSSSPPAEDVRSISLNCGRLVSSSLF